MTGSGNQRPLHVWVLSDDQPGHYNLSRGLVAALERVQPVEQHWLTLQLRFGLARNLLRFALNNRAMPPSTDWLKRFYRMPGLPQAPCDLIVSAGGKTSFANAWLAQHLQAKNLFFGSLRRLSPALFTQVVTLEPLVPAACNNLVLDLPPSAIDAEQLRAHGQALRAQLAPDPRPLWLLMLGGNGAGYRYEQQDWQQLADWLNRQAEAQSIRWLLLGSRRTGEAAERFLAQALKADNVAASCWYRTAAPDCVQQYLGAADVVCVTEDSMTMLTEAIHAQRPVISLRPQSVAATGRYAAMVQRFQQHGWLMRYSIAGLAAPDRLPVDAPEAGLQSLPLDDLAIKLEQGLDLSRRRHTQ